MNFTFLQNLEDFKQLYDFCTEAEESVYKYPDLSAISSRKALESLIKSFYCAKYGGYPEDCSLFEMIYDARFSSYLDDSLLTCVHFIRKIGNNGAHSEKVTKKEAISVLEALHETVVEILYFLGITFDNKEFDKNIYDKELNADFVPDKTDKEVDLKNKDDFLKYKENINDSIVLKSAINFTEAETRKLYIDTALKEAGWTVNPNNKDPKAGTACPEIDLEGMPNKSGIGRADYILYDDDTKPLAVIEAKKTSVDEVVGAQQAKLYGDLIEKQCHRRPIIYYTNGYNIKVIDNAGYPARRVYGYYTKEEMHSMIVRRNESHLITSSKIDKNISDRYFIQEAATAVCEAFNKRARKALVVMATGTGKTRFAISLIDVLQRCNWVKRVLFLADRTALVNQAKNAFSKFLPNSSLCVLSQESEKDRDYKARVTLSTYQTMINLIDCEDKKYGIGAFDLIVVDECHRSIYNKYRAIFNYFDSLVLGLTATPREQVDKSTYDVFDLPKGEPTYSYDYETAVKEGFLVNYHAFERTTNILKDGITYDDLNDEEKEEYENLFKDETGNFPKKIDGNKFYNEIINYKTIDKVLNTIMNEGIRVNSGEILGKTIIFAVDHTHAELIVERFKKFYKEYGNDYCQLIDNTVNYSQSLIDEFSIKDNNFRIAVSVDMLDTGIDVPEVVNLVFFKRVFSKIKFWQMIGRGTRVCKNLGVISPDKESFEYGGNILVSGKHEDKQGFYIFDFCNVFEFFRLHPDGRETGKSYNLTQRIFNCKLDMVFELQKYEHQNNEEHKKYYLKYKEELFNKITKLNRNLINVRTALKYVDKYSFENNWDYLTIFELKEIKNQITFLIDPNSDDESSKYFDLWLFNMELAYLEGDKDYSVPLQKVNTICSFLLQRLTIPQVQLKKEILEDIVRGKYWKNINMDNIEFVRQEVRDLIMYLEHKERKIIESNFEDDVITLLGGEPVKPNFKNYKQKVLDYLTDNINSGVVYKIRNLIALNEDDINELEKILCNDLGNKDDYDKVSNGKEFGVFVRQIVGLDNDALMNSLFDYLGQHEFNSKQQEFIHQIINFVLENGDITIKDLVTKEPFMSLPYTEWFTDRKKLYEFVNMFHITIQG